MIFEITREKNIDLEMHYISTISNPADTESRKLSLQDWNLSPKSLDSVDLMALDSNVMLNKGV